MITIQTSAWTPAEADISFDICPQDVFHLSIGEIIMLAANEEAMRRSPYGWDASVGNSKPALNTINGRPC